MLLLGWVSYFYPKDVFSDVLLKHFYASNPANQDHHITSKISSLAIQNTNLSRGIHFLESMSHF